MASLELCGVCMHIYIYKYEQQLEQGKTRKNAVSGDNIL